MSFGCIHHLFVELKCEMNHKSMLNSQEHGKCVTSSG